MEPKQETKQTMNEQPVIMEPAAQLAVTATHEKKPLSRLAFGVLVVALSAVAGFGGSFAYWASGMGGANIETISSERVVMQEGEVVADVAEKVGPSVVSIVTESTAETFWGYSSSQQAAGTGIIISKDGYVVTNKHVVSSETDSVVVVGADGTQYEEVEFVGSDPSNDISFLKINGVSNLSPATLGDSSVVEVGQKVIAIGNALGEYQNTVTTGIISALSRPVVAATEDSNEAESLENLLQTDAAINPGNSGGPLVNLSGEVIGINTAVASDAEGIGFAIPANDIKGMVKTLLATNKVVKPYIGIRYVSITPAIVKEYDLSVTKGALILAGEDGDGGVLAGSPAAVAGLREKDIITKVGKVAIDATHPFASVIAQHSPGDKVSVTFVREGKEQTVSVTVGSR